nr:DUF5691 domain-containing protein [Nocardiopsis sinuspersici]
MGPERKGGLPVTGTRAPASPDPLAPADSWGRLVSAALVGTSRRSVPDTPDLPDLPGASADEGADALLGRAALAAVRRVAGYTPATGITPLTPDTEDERPEVGRAATDRLERIVEGREDLLPEWLELVAAGGRHAAHSSLPALLGQGVRHSRLRPAISAAIGTRGQWMARFEPSWSYVLAEPLPTDRFGERDWEHGTPGERRRALVALRAADPGRGRDLLTAAWPGLARAELRRGLLEALATGLGPGDEDLLGGALDDRSANVRGTALSLLTRMPGSAHAERLRGYVREHASQRGDGSLRVDSVHTRDAAVHRDLALAAPTGPEETKHQRHERVWALVTHAPLDVWPGLLGTDPSGVLAAAGGEAARSDGLFDAFVNAVTVQRDTEWARAVLGTLGLRAARDRGSFQLDKLLDLLPVQERCAHVCGVLDGAEASLVRWAQLLRATRGPWTRELSARVVGLLHTARPKHDPHGYQEVCGAAAEHMPPEHLADLHEQPPIDGSSADTYLRLRDTLRFRLDMHREF